MLMLRGKAVRFGYCCLFVDVGCNVRWLDRVVRVSKEVGPMKNKKSFSSDEQSRLFLVNTTTKTLFLMANSAKDADEWISHIQLAIDNSRKK